MPYYRSSMNTSSVKGLTKKWEVKTRSNVTAKPLKVNNRILVSDWDGYIYCFNAQSGALMYEKQLYKPAKNGKILSSTPIVNRFFTDQLPYLWNGFAGTGCIDEGIWYLASVGGQPGGIFSNGAPGKAYAVNSTDGNVLWERELGKNKYSGSLAVPLVNGNNIFFGLCSVDEPASTVYNLFLKKFVPECVGEVFCIDSKTGRTNWHIKVTELLKDDNKDARGAGVWGGFSLDKDKEKLYFATGNSYGQPVSKASDSILSVKSANGSLVFSYQAVEGDAWMPLKRDGPDYDFGCTPLYYPCSKTESGWAVAAGNKNGYVYSLDSNSGKLLWKAYCHKDSEPEDGIRSNTTYYAGRLYVWSKNKIPGNSMSVCCIDANTGAIVWNKVYDGTNAMATGLVTNDLYFLSNYSGEIYALDIKDGSRVWLDSVKKASLGSDLALYSDRIYSGFGVPGAFGGKSTYAGVVCYELG